ncbi:MAG: hypothetical protein EOP11_02210 [Proteobacteria bacterium]|nr:MAG: hypothetical protein EOP11_02210 [Pseudomonadota bacterium]
MGTIKISVLSLLALVAGAHAQANSGIGNTPVIGGIGVDRSGVIGGIGVDRSGVIGGIGVDRNGSVPGYNRAGSVYPGSGSLGSRPTQGSEPYAGGSYRAPTRGYAPAPSHGRGSSARRTGGRSSIDNIPLRGPGGILQ